MSLVTSRGGLGGRSAFPLLWATAVVAAAASCTEKGRSVVPVHITADQTVPSSLHQVRAVVTQGAATVGGADATWPASAAFVDLGVFVAKSVSGSVDVIACGFDASGNPVAASGTQSTTVQPGATASQVNLVLSAGTPSALCAIVLGTGGTTGTGGSGTGGAAGATATGGSGGSTGGSGGGGMAAAAAAWRAAAAAAPRARAAAAPRATAAAARPARGAAESPDPQAARRAPVESAAPRSSGRGAARWASAPPRPPLR